MTDNGGNTAGKRGFCKDAMLKTFDKDETNSELQ